MDAQLSTGHLFLPKKKGVGSPAPFAAGSRPLARKSVESVLQTGLAAAGLRGHGTPRGTKVTIRSFRASGADYALAQPEQPLRTSCGTTKNHWSSEYKLNLREAEVWVGAGHHHGRHPVGRPGGHPRSYYCRRLAGHAGPWRPDRAAQPGGSPYRRVEGNGGTCGAKRHPLPQPRPLGQLAKTNPSGPRADSQASSGSSRADAPAVTPVTSPAV